ncbi:MAG: primosomal protein N', partial [Clostridia bacterium]|nr:primosomal protein N' [Clostridia bacterium]
MDEIRVARVCIIGNIPYNIDKPYDYYVPDDLRDEIRAGVFVAVSFGRGRGSYKALVVEVTDVDADRAAGLKPIISAVDKDAGLTDEQLKLCLFIKEHTFCTVAEAVRTMIPQTVECKYTVYAEATEKAADYVDGGSKLRSAAQTRILCDLSLAGRLSADELKEEHGASPAQIRSLADKGLIRLTRYDEFRDPVFSGDGKTPENELNGEQAAAKERLTALLDENAPRAALLHGVTGSGKTRVIIAVTQEALARGRQVIILVPEIALTPQTLGLFSSFFKDDIAVMHSSLSAGERYDSWRRMRLGLAHVCIGTRSAVFAPFDDLGLIVIDEEQEHTYKSDSDPKYSAVDVARFRCGANNALMLLASATPSLSSYYKAVTGKYELVELNERYGDARLPDAAVYDMRKEYRAGNLGSIGALLKKELSETLDEGKQAIIFINRRGYNHYVSCPQCGTVMVCPHCSVSLTNHTVRGRR